MWRYSERVRFESGVMHADHGAVSEGHNHNKDTSQHQQDKRKHYDEHNPPPSTLFPGDNSRQGRIGTWSITSETDTNTLSSIVSRTRHQIGRTKGNRASGSSRARPPTFPASTVRSRTSCRPPLRPVSVHRPRPGDLPADVRRTCLTRSSQIFGRYRNHDRV